VGSEVLSGENQGVSISLRTESETETGEALEITETDEYVAGVGLVGQEAELGDSSPPDSFRGLERLSQGEPSVVTERATVTIQQEEEEPETENNETEEGNETDGNPEEDTEQEGLPGFGLIGGAVAALGTGAVRLFGSSGEDKE